MQSSFAHTFFYYLLPVSQTVTASRLLVFVKLTLRQVNLLAACQTSLATRRSIPLLLPIDRPIDRRVVDPLARSQIGL